MNVLMDLERLPDERVVSFLLHVLANSAEHSEVRIHVLKRLRNGPLTAAERCRTIFRAEVDAALERIDALVLPTLPIVPPRLGETADARAVLRLTAFVRPFNVSGHPALSIPLATEANLPVGLQVVGRRGGDAALCATAHRLVPQSAETHPGEPGRACLGISREPRNTQTGS